MARTGPLLLAIIAVYFFGRVHSAEYLGKFLGQLSELHHAVSGEVYAVDGRTLHIKDFTYDGQGPAAYFYASTYKTADSRGFRLRDENNNGDVIRRYRKEHVTLTLPEGKTLNNIKIFYVWCEEFDVNFGDIKIPRSFDFPRPQKIDALKGVHSISSDNIVIVDAQTLLIPNLHYDGEAPDAKFWVGRSSKPSPQGIRVMDENGKELPLRRYDGKTIVLTLPGDLTVFDIGHFGIWCEQFTVDFGHIQIPQTLNVPPSLKMLGVSPQSKLNCEVLNDDMAFEVRWAVAGESIVLQLVGKLDNREYMSFGLSGDDSKSVMIGGDVVVAWVDKETLKGYAQDYYLADKSQCSGPTGSCPDNRLEERTNNIRLLNAAMVNGYSIVTYQRPLKASDNFDLPIYTNHSQAIIWAIGPLNQRDEVSFHSSYLKRDSFIDFARPAKWNCPLPEGEPMRKPASIENRQRIAASDKVTEPQPTQPAEPVTLSTTTAPRREGVNRRRGGGTRVSNRQPVTSTAEAEEGQASIREPTRTRGSSRVNQKATQTRTVPPPTPVNNRNAWYIPPIQCYEPEDGVFYAQMGPTGGKMGYPAITGHVGWGISWYINGLLIPEINVVRGKTYTFVVEGGHDPEVSAKYHPFYITDDPVGGYAYKTPEEQKQVRILAGATQAKDGSVHPTGTGRLCHWTHTGDSDADDFDSFGAYQRTLQLKCDGGEPGFIQWTPDKNTPDTVYYQCFTHRYLGWKINVLDSCDEQGAASEPKPSIVEAPNSNLDSFSDKSSIELEASASIQEETRVIPNTIITEENPSNNKKSKPTVSEILPTLDPTTPTSQHNQDKIPNMSFLFQSRQNHLIDPLNQVNSFALPYHTSGHYVNHNKDASSFRPSPTIDAIEDFPVIIFQKPVGKRTTTQSLVANFLPEISNSNFQTVHKTNLNNFTYIALSLNNASQASENHFKTDLPVKQSLQVLHMPLKHANLKTQNLQYPVVLNEYQSSFLRPIHQKMHSSVQYNTQSEFKHNPNFKTLQNKPQLLLTKLKSSAPVQSQFITYTVPMAEIKNVEISLQQASTEREPEIQTASPLISIRPIMNENVNFKTPVNTGFNPGSVITEEGFKPIISKDIEDRVGEIEPEVDLEGQSGVIQVKGTKFEKQHNQEEKLVHLLLSSLSDIVSKPNNKKIYKKPIKKDVIKAIGQPRNLIDSDIELEMAAAERVDSFYLPPPGQTDKPRISASKQPSAIDFDTPHVQSAIGPSLTEFAPDTVVTYDGKKVSGASLTAKPFEKSTLLGQRGSKAAELIKAHPQFVPFRGDLPPLNQNVLFGIKSHQSNTHSGVLSRNLDTPLLPSGSTKLTRVRRAAHHNPEHTAEQMRQMNQTKNNSSNSGSKSLMQFGFVSLVFSIVLLNTFID